MPKRSHLRVAGCMEPGSCPPYAWHLPVSRQQPTTALAPESRPYRVISGATDVYELRRCGTPRATHIGDDMLRITIHDDGKVRRLELAGKLKGPWVAETEKAWRASLHPGQKIEIDLRQLTSVDNAGRDLLAAIYRSGACLIFEGVWMTALIGDLTSHPCKGAKVQSSRKKVPRRPKSRQQESNK